MAFPTKPLRLFDMKNMHACITDKIHELFNPFKPLLPRGARTRRLNNSESKERDAGSAQTDRTTHSSKPEQPGLESFIPIHREIT
jgi:hypothetical protein